ncbi:MAG TPA: hypothetical protein VGF55_25205 [Gemmataceae bacterium]|jgi:hypothetical protein
MKSRLPVLILVSLLSGVPGGATAADSPEPGPEDGGLRLRLVVTPRADGAKDGYDVRLELVNASGKAVAVRANWPDDRGTGGVGNYLEAAASIETVPPIAPWVGGVGRGRRTSPQQEHVLKPGETLTVGWRTDGPYLKNHVTDPHEAQNPRFPVPGLYAVHATVNVATDAGRVWLRSNEQLVPVGGSRAMPKSTFGQLLSVDPDKRTAALSLGSLHKVAVGDQFEVGSRKGGRWKLTITRVEPGMSFGDVEVLQSFRPPPEPNMPAARMDATLIETKG